MKNAPYPHRSSREDLILNATDRLLARFGYRTMTVEDIAKEAGAYRAAESEWMWTICPSPRVANSVCALDGQWARKVPVASKTIVTNQVRGWPVKH
jgi:hypothetical protein